ncbi:3-carboxy-cis,cis-muconate cycloisomerase [Actinomycetes bacterium M1A6_2h]
MNTRGPLFDPTFGAADLAYELSDQAWVSALLSVETALSVAGAAVGLVAASDAESIADAAGALSRDGRIDIGELGTASAAGGNPVIPLVKLLRSEVAPRGVAAASVHPGATSQDVMDTALVLMLRRAGDVILGYATSSVQDALDLAREHRHTPMAARTLGQQALPTTFGAVAAGWAAGLHRATLDLRRALDGLPVQFGGAAGTLAAVHPHGLEMADAVARHLGLPQQTAPWHTDRTPFAAVAAALGVLAGAVAKPATDVVLMSATELTEVTEGAPGGSSAMPHKQNPVAAITARAAAQRVPGLVSTVLYSMAHEQQRAAGPWHAEWETLTDLARVAGGSAARLADCLGGLRVDRESMARNLDVTHGQLLAERVTTALSALTDNARTIVTEACRLDVPLFENNSITEFLPADRVRQLLDPADYLGHAADIVDRTLASITGSESS